ncbi:MAG: glucose 1-dehydrogenase [Chloroflexi bacterium]|nr:glucose 1-dehydrogenase [Chloroflexota bacterium]
MFLEKWDIKGQVALVTGGSRGIGRAIALGLAEAGADVAVASRKLADLEPVAAEVKALGRRSLAVSANMGRTEDIRDLVQRVVAEFGRIDILINNAGTNPVLGPVLDADERAWDLVFAVNVKGYFLLARAVCPIMREHGGGRIVNVASHAGVTPHPDIGLYSVSKAAVIMLTKVLAKEWGEYNVRVNCIAPGVLQTKFSTVLWATEKYRKRTDDLTALHRIGQPGETVGAALFLASEASSYVTGETILVDGGFLP